MKIVVSGSTGLIGTAMTAALRQRGDDVVPLVRHKPSAGERAIAWDPERGTIDRAGLEGVDAVIHLAGENVFGRWTTAKKQRIRDSRIKGTQLICENLGALRRPPATLLASSAIGYYGDRGDESLTEESGRGNDFLAQVARDWEAATSAAVQTGIRVVNLRTGVVLTPSGGALAKMLPPFRLGLGGHVGSGDQYVSWIAVDDLVRAIVFVLDHREIVGPVNLTAPTPVTNRELAKALGKVLGRPAIVPVPGFALRLAFGTEGAEMLLSGQRVLPARLLAAGFQYSFEALEPALRHLLASPERRPVVSGMTLPETYGDDPDERGRGEGRRRGEGGEPQEQVSKRSRGVALLLALFGGIFGLHRFYVDKTATAIPMLLTFGGFGVWYLYDLVLIAAGEFRDGEDLPLRHWEVAPSAFTRRRLLGRAEQRVNELEEQLDAMRQQFSELAERVDFAERMLAQRREPPAPKLPRGS